MAADIVAIPTRMRIANGTNLRTLRKLDPRSGVISDAMHATSVPSPERTLILEPRDVKEYAE